MMDPLPEIMTYRWKRVIPPGAIGQKDNTTCPRCGAAGAYRFAGGYKVCDSCGLSTRFERFIRDYRRCVRQDRLDEFPHWWAIKLLLAYIRDWTKQQGAR